VPRKPLRSKRYLLSLVIAAGQLIIVKNAFTAAAAVQFVDKDDNRAGLLEGGTARGEVPEKDDGTANEAGSPWLSLLLSSSLSLPFR
jgi:hypothetical protein